MADIDNSLSDNLSASDNVSVFVSVTPYCTIDWANQLALELLGTGPWDNATEANQDKALRSATRMIDRLNFAGEKADPDQSRQFPRGTDTAVPQNIMIATFYIALALLDGRETELELQDTVVTKHRIGPVETDYDRSKAPEHILAGIPSLEAWLYIKPYLRRHGSVVVSRTS